MHPAVEKYTTRHTLPATYGNNTYAITLKTPLSIVERNTAVPSVTLDMNVDGSTGFEWPEELVDTNGDPYKLIETGTNQYVAQREDGRGFTIKLPNLTTSDGSNVFVANESRIPIGESVSYGSELPTVDSMAPAETEVKTWTNGQISIEHGYTETVTVSDSGHGITGYFRHYTGYVSRSYYDQTITQQLAQITKHTGTLKRTVVTTFEIQSGTYTFAGWEVDGQLKKPGEEVLITANVQIRPRFKSETVTDGYEQRTIETEGTLAYVYNVTRKNVQVSEQRDYKQDNLPGDSYCEYKAHDKYLKGKKADAIQSAINKNAVKDSAYNNNYGENVPKSGTRDYAATPETGENNFTVSKTVSDTTQHFDHNPLNP